jgi:SAM-dependent methyltransferase
MATPAPPSGEYVFGHADRELARLIAQATVFRPSMDALLRSAGIGPGLRVLDAGCGAGDVSFLVAELVGPEGQVVGVDRSAAVLATAHSRLAALHLPQVTFLESDLDVVTPDGVFDAVVGRQVLAYVANPVAVLTRLASFVRPGGLVVFQEPDVVARAWPPLPLYAQCWQWVIDVAHATGARADMGMRLLTTFVDAGLPAPQVRMDGIVASGDDWAGAGWTAENVRTLLPALERFGMATTAEIDIETLEARLRSELVAGGGVVCPMVQCGAWTRTVVA